MGYPDLFEVLTTDDEIEAALGKPIFSRSCEESWIRSMISASLSLHERPLLWWPHMIPPGGSMFPPRAIYRGLYIR